MPKNSPALLRDPKKLLRLAATYLDDGAPVTALAHANIAAIYIEAQIAKRNELLHGAEPVPAMTFDRKAIRILRRTYGNA